MNFDWWLGIDMGVRWFDSDDEKMEYCARNKDSFVDKLEVIENQKNKNSGESAATYVAASLHHLLFMLTQ